MIKKLQIQQQEPFLRCFISLLGLTLALWFQPINARAQWLDGSSSWLNTGGTTLYTQDNVGIGTTSPDTGLSIRNGNQLYSIGGGGFAYDLISLLLPSTANGNSRMVIGVGSGTAPWLTFGGGYEGLYGTTFEVRTDTSEAGSAGNGYPNLGPALVVKRTSQDGSTTNVLSTIGVTKLYSLTADGIQLATGPKATPSLVINQGSGNVGIGTTIPGVKLDVQSGSSGLVQVSRFWSSSSGGPAGTGAYIGLGTNVNIAEIEANNDASSGGSLRLRTLRGGTLTEAMRITDQGNVGIGTTSPAAKLDVVQNNIPVTGGVATTLQRATFGYANSSGSYLSTGVYTNNSYGVAFLNHTWGDLALGANYNGNTYSPIVFLQGTGNVGIGTTSPGAKLHVVGDAAVTGNMTVTGNIAAKYQDVAEWVPASRPIPAGMVVVLDSNNSNQVVPSSREYDTRVAGVVSDTPGILLGEDGYGKVKVATTGRVKVKVDAGKGSIQVGDLLVTSEKEGIAMKSQPLDLGGVPIHRPGTLIGKALEPLTQGDGEILVLLSLQ